MVLTNLRLRSSEGYHTKGFIGCAIITTLLILTVIITAVTIASELIYEGKLSSRSIIGVCCTVYLLVSWLTLKSGYHAKAYWMLLTLLIVTGIFNLLYRGVQSPPGLLTLTTAILIPGTLLKSRFTIPVTAIIISFIFCIQTIHSTTDYPLYNQSDPAPTGDVLLYTIMLSFISLMSYLSIQRSEYSLRRARQAEKKLIAQKDRLKVRLAEESAKLRANQFKEVQQFYAFAALGQNTAATLHELSNHLSILGMDIEDLHDTHQHSKAVAETQKSFNQITSMIKTIRRQFNTYSSGKIITPYSIIRNTVSEISLSPACTNIGISMNAAADCKYLKAHGDPVALSHIITILLKNSIEACAQLPDAKINVFLIKTKSNLRITITDNGLGLPEKSVSNIFTPQSSTKPTGLGAGLFIARSLLKTHFKGSISLISNGKANSDNRYLCGATFSIYIPFAAEGAV